MASVSNVVKFKTTGGTVYDSVQDWGLTLESFDAQKPGGKWQYVDVPGAPGSIDLSRALSQDVPPEMRTLKMLFGYVGATHAAAVSQVETIVSKIHLQQMLIQTPDDTADSLWYSGNVEVTKITYVDTGAHIEVVATCDPYRYSGTGGALNMAATGYGSQWASTTADPILKPTGDVEPVARWYGVSFDAANTVPQSDGNKSVDRVAVYTANSSNLFDLNQTNMLGKTVRVSPNVGSWVNSGKISQDGQKASFGPVAKEWVERICIFSTSSTVINRWACFPFTGNTRCKVYLYSDPVTAVEAGTISIPNGPTVSAGVYLYAYNGLGNAENIVLDNGTTSGAWQYVTDSIAAPAVGSAYNGDVLEFANAINLNTFELTITVAGISCPNIYALVEFYKADGVSTGWVAPEVEKTIWQTPYPVMREWQTHGASYWCANIAYDMPARGTMDVYALTADSFAVDMQAPQTPAFVYAQPTGLDSSGWPVLPGEPLTMSANNILWASTTIDAGSQPVFPTATVKHDGAVSYNGAVFALPGVNDASDPANVLELTQVLNRGVNAVKYAFISGGITYTNTLTWPKGVL